MSLSFPRQRLLRGASYVVAVAGVSAVAMLLQWFPWLFERGAFAMLLGCVFLCTWLGGWRSGLLAIVLSIWLTAYQMYLYEGGGADRAQDWIRLGIFVAVALMVAVLSASRDRAVESARISSSRLQGALEAARMGAWEKHLETGLFWSSAGLEELFGRRPGQFVPDYEGFIEYIHPEDREFVSKAFTRSVENGSEFEVAHRIVRPDRTIRWVITRGRIIHGPSGRPERLIGVAADVTERYAAGDAVGRDLPPESAIAPASGRL